MIFCVYQSKLCIGTLLFYTCIYFPLVQTKRLLVTILSFILYHPLSYSNCSAKVLRETCSCSIDLPMVRFGDLKCTSSCEGGGGGEAEEACSVCLVEFESEDLVSQLSKCRHVFHMSCIERWLERNQFTCPLCRTVFLNVVEGCKHVTCSISCN